MLKLYNIARASSKLTPLPSISLTNISIISDFSRRYKLFLTLKRNLPVNFTLKIDLDPKISTSEYIELIFCLHTSNHPVLDLIPELKSKLKKDCKLSLNAYSNLLGLMKQSVFQPDSDLESKIFEMFLQNSTQIKLIDFVYIADLLLSKIIKTDNKQVYVEIEKYIIKNLDSLTIAQISTVLRCFSSVIFLYPSDIHVRVEEFLAGKAKDMSWENLLNILSIYASVQRTHHFMNLAKAASLRIQENPSEFFGSGKPMFVLGLHFFTKFRAFDEINQLVVKYVPKIDERWKAHPTFLGMFILCILRKPPSPEYKSQIITELFNHSSSLEFFRKKKIIISMINDPNPFFWSNVHKLKVFWQPSEQVFLKQSEQQILQQHNLIRP